MDISLVTLFFSAFISSTLFPGGSEVGLVYLFKQGDIQTWQLITVASLGNTLGGMTSWGLGWLLAKRYSAETMLKQNHRKALARLRQWGNPVLLLSWLPVVGDPLCVAAGWLGLNGWMSLLYIGLGKTLRYLLLIYILG
jgi:membrane protein YqaA with SNARE-associated domain